ncbi:hypothetical protein [Streptomyces sp. CAU 1734]|uniref:hypothetical protein n=1 Tax=Streptomyces sp. CAU 1734 TaxID=3140360 RepID=UPI0032609EE5
MRHKPYPYDIDTHCGVKWAEFGGRWWVLDSVHPGGAAVRGGPAPRHGGRLAGHMTLTGPDAAFFEAAGMPAMEFVPAGEEPPGCA